MRASIHVYVYFCVYMFKSHGEINFNFMRKWLLVFCVKDLCDALCETQC